MDGEFYGLLYLYILISTLHFVNVIYWYIMLIHCQMLSHPCPWDKSSLNMHTEFDWLFFENSACMSIKDTDSLECSFCVCDMVAWFWCHYLGNAGLS